MILAVSLLVLPLAQAINLQYYEGPQDKTEAAFQDWFSEFTALRDEIEAGLDLAIYYDVPEVAWARKSFVQPQLMIHDRCWLILARSRDLALLQVPLRPRGGPIHRGQVPGRRGAKVPSLVLTSVNQC